MGKAGRKRKWTRMTNRDRRVPYTIQVDAFKSEGKVFTAVHPKTSSSLLVRVSIPFSLSLSPLINCFPVIDNDRAEFICDLVFQSFEAATFFEQLFSHKKSRSFYLRRAVGSSFRSSERKQEAGTREGRKKCTRRTCYRSSRPPHPSCNRSLSM